MLSYDEKVRNLGKRAETGIRPYKEPKQLRGYIPVSPNGA